MENDHRTTSVEDNTLRKNGQEMNSEYSVLDLIAFVAIGQPVKDSPKLLHSHTHMSDFITTSVTNRFFFPPQTIHLIVDFVLVPKLIYNVQFINPTRIRVYA